MRAAHLLLRCFIVAVLVTASCVAHAQPKGFMPVITKYALEDGNQFILVSKNIDDSALNKFVRQYNLEDIPLKFFLKTNRADTLQKLGWQVVENNKEVVALLKPLMSYDRLLNPGEKMGFIKLPPGKDEGEQNQRVFGFNSFKHKHDFAVNGNEVTFYLRNHQNASKVLLAGSFTKWQTNAIAMTKTDSGWIARVKLAEDKYWYKFIADGSWMTDEDNRLQESDGLGNINSVYYKTNVLFVLPGHADAKKVYVAGSFNDWHEKEILLNKTAGGWQLPFYLAEGTHTYKFIADGNWHEDESNPLKLPDGAGGFNSVLEFGTPHLFKLKGYTSAQHVYLAGSFNGWREDEHAMHKTSEGWELPYVLGAGNYEYKFVVDGNWIADPANLPLAGGNNNDANSVVIINPNYTFRLKGFNDAKQVFIAGDFNNWTPNSLPMIRQGNEWRFRVYLPYGKHIYKFIVDDKWILDPANELWEQNEYGTNNSVMWLNNPAFSN